MRTLVTGGAGFIGSNLVDALLDDGHEVAVLDDLSSGREANLEDARSRGAALHRADVRDPDQVRRVVAETSPQAIFHLAAQIDVRKSVADPAFDARTNIEGTINVLRAAIDAEARVINVSTGGAIYGDAEIIPTPETVEPLPEAPYGQSKFCAERYLGLFGRLHGLRGATCRLGNVYGPRQDPLGEAGVIAIFCGKLQAGERPTVYGTGRQTRDYVYVGDVVRALLAVLAHEDASGEYNVGTGKESSVLDIVEALAPYATADFEPVFAPARLGEMERSCLDVTRAREELGWEPQVDLAEGLRRTVEWTASAGV
ncbi:MAG: SDR family NAD(P)-dependent oxidoreductase [Solirubrobacteraceae bacterium]|nr:SDR family NAD(P)-dependent oxidoreductase [Solirubrobacteraceae bacterium]